MVNFTCRLLQVNFELNFSLLILFQIWLHWFCDFQGQFHLAKSSLRQALEVAHASILPFWQFKITFQLAVSVLRGDGNLLSHSGFCLVNILTGHTRDIYRHGLIWAWIKHLTPGGRGLPVSRSSNGSNQNNSRRFTPWRFTKYTPYAWNYKPCAWKLSIRNIL